MQSVILLGCVLLAGLLQPVQMAMNTKLNQTAQSPMLAVMLSSAGGLLVAAAFYAVGLLGRGQPLALGHAPWWAWLSGPIGAVAVAIAFIALPRSNAALIVAFTVLGQAAAGLILDNYGLMDIKKVPISMWRVGGVILILGGTLLMQKR